MASIAITGASGYVGSALAEGLRAAGAQVLPLGRGSGARAFRLEEPPALGLWDGADTLVHAAYDFRAHGWDEIAAVNIEGTRRLFSSAAAAGIRRFVLISTLSAFPGCRSLYGRAKLETEAIASGHGAIVIRPGLVFGERSGGMIGALGRLASLPGAIPLVGDGRYPQYLAHQDDLARLVAELALGAQQPGGPVTAAHREPRTIRAILTELAAAEGRRPRFFPIPVPLIGAGLALAEAAGLRPKLRRDSLVGLVHQNPSPDFGPLERLGFSFRPFQAARRTPAAPR